MSRDSQGKRKARKFRRTGSPASKAGLPRKRVPVRIINLARRSGWQGSLGQCACTPPRKLGGVVLEGYGSGPFSTMRRISDEMDRLFDSFGFGRSFFPSEFGQGAQARYGDLGASALWAPHVDVVERDGKLLISADLPGVKKEDVKVEINPDSVTLQGQRHQEKQQQRPRLLSERAQLWQLLPDHSAAGRRQHGKGLRYLPRRRSSNRGAGAEPAIPRPHTGNQGRYDRCRLDRLKAGSNSSAS
mgnify:CR=1 FL=1